MSRPLSTSDWAVLAYLGEAPAHGFKLASIFAKGGELGHIWTLQKPQVYRALEHLESRALITAVKEEPGDNGPPRTLYALTEQGQAQLESWFASPVLRIRDGRSDLLLKLIFMARRDIDAQPLLKAQEQHFLQVLATYQAKLNKASSAERTVLRWRIEIAQAALAFIRQEIIFK
ncbi:MAG: PadR family transcriptional regulator [Trueperaceae bacterium]|nr:PadR family transcriptional regulator [Trueperaceae bacterium]